MSRPLRVEFAGALYHVTARGNERKPIYREESDFSLFLDFLGKACERFNWVIHAYCQMPNHCHLLVETPDRELVERDAPSEMVCIHKDSIANTNV